MIIMITPNALGIGSWVAGSPHVGNFLSRPPNPTFKASLARDDFDVCRGLGAAHGFHCFSLRNFCALLRLEGSLRT